MPRDPSAESTELRPDDENPSSRPPEARMADVLDAQHRVIQRSEIVDLGLTKDQIHKRVKRGSLHRKQRGVYTAGNPALDARGEIHAAVMAVGADAYADGLSACALWGVREARPGEEVQVVCRRDVDHRPGVRVRLQRDLPERDTSMRHGIRTVSPARALLGVAATTKGWGLRRLVNQMLVEKRVSLPQLIDLVARYRGRRGVARLAAVLAASTPTRSEVEDMMVAALHAYGAEFATNARVAGREVDVLFEAARVVVEVDSRYHDNPVARSNDAAKDRILEAAGHVVVRVRAQDATADMHRTIPRILALVAGRVDGTSP